MIFFLLATFLTVSAVPVDHAVLLQNLVSTEGASVKQILDMIEQLRNDNAQTISTVTKENDDAKNDLAEAKQALDVAIKAEELALGNHEDALKTLADLVEKEDEARTVEKDAKNKLDIAQRASDEANAFLDSENIRIDEERKTCEEIIVLLTRLSASATKEFISDLAQNNRRLLSIIDLSDLAGADPSAVKEVEDMINQLIADGETERENVKAAATLAASQLDDAKAVHKDKLELFNWASGERVIQDERVANLEGVATRATATTKKAQSTHDAADIHQKSTQTAFDFETNRVEGEEKVFVEVEQLLSTLKQ